MILEMPIISIPTRLIHAQQWARRSGNGRGSVACTEQGGENGITRSQLFVRVSRARLRCIPKDETQRGVNSDPTLHGDLRDVLTRAGDLCSVPDNQPSPRAFNEKVNGVQSRPNHDNPSHSVNMGSPTLAASVKRSLHGDGVPIVPKSLPVMGETAGNQTGSNLGNKSPVMVTNPRAFEGKWNSQCVQSMPKRRNASAFR